MQVVYDIGVCLFVFIYILPGQGSSTPITAVYQILQNSRSADMHAASCRSLPLQTLTSLGGYLRTWLVLVWQAGTFSACVAKARHQRNGAWQMCVSGRPARVILWQLCRCFLRHGD